MEGTTEEGVKMPKSMTGFARVEKEYGEGKLSGEARSLNSRYLEINIKLPRIDYFYEQKLRELVKKRIKRGKVDISVKWEKSSEQINIPKINESTIKQYTEMIKALKKSCGLKGDLTVDNIFTLKDIFVYEENNNVTEEKLIDCFGVLMVDLNNERAKEGQILEKDLLSKIEIISSNLSEIEARWPDTIKTHEEKLKEKIMEATKTTTIDETRILQEIAIYMERIDLSEEIVRLKGHIDNFKITLNSDEPIGRKLDFIIQEMVRETNTIGSKSNDLYINERVIQIKVEIEKMREQVQNVE
jgi:uncharacterized protein (TIGR00255 family)